MPGSSQDILAQNNINRFRLIHLFRDIVNVDVNDTFSASTTFSQKTFPTCRSETMWTLPPLQGDNDADAGDYNGDRKKIIYVDIDVMEFMKYLLVSLFHSGNLTFQLSFWANQALPKGKVRGIIQSSLSMHFWPKTSSHHLYHDYVISVWRKRASSPISVLEIGRAGSPMHHRWGDEETNDHVIMVIVMQKEITIMW